MNKKWFFVVLIVSILAGCDRVEDSDSTSKKSQQLDSSVNDLDKSVDSQVSTVKVVEMIEPEVLEVAPSIEDVGELITTESSEESYAGEEFFPTDPEFSPQVKEAIEIVEGRAASPKPAPELKQEYKDVAEILESQMDGY